MWAEIHSSESTQADFKLSANESITHNGATLLVDYLVRIVETFEYEEDFFDSWNLCKSAILLIGAFCSTNVTVALSLSNTVKQKLISPDLNVNQSGLQLLSGLLNTTKTDLINKLLIETINSIFALLNSSSFIVRVTVSLVLNKLVENHSSFINADERIKELLNAVLPHLKEENRMSINICWILRSLAIKFGDKKTEKSKNKLTPYFGSIVGQLLEAAVRDGAYSTEHNLAIHAFYAIGYLAEYSSQDSEPILDNLLVECSNYFNNTLETKSKSNYDYQDLIAGLINTVLKKKLNAIDPKTAEYLYYQIKSSFTVRGDVYESGIALIGTIAQKLKDNFAVFMPDFKEYIKFALSQYKNKILLYATTICLNDVVNAIKEKFGEYNELFSSIVYELLCSEEVKRQNKVSLIALTGDIAMVIPNEFSPYAKKFLDVFISANELAKDFPEDVRK